MSLISVSHLAIYPVKSLRGIAVPSFELATTGPHNDRQWMVVDAHDKFITQRTCTEICLIETRLEGQQLILSKPGFGDVSVPRGGGHLIEATVWRDQVLAQDCGEPVAAWLTTVLGQDCRLVFMPEGNERPVDDSPARVGFADAYPLLLTSESSLQEFNSHLDEDIGMERFRPNIVLSGSAAYAEDHWQNIRIGEVQMRVNSPCTRCIVPSINPETATKHNEVIVALNTTRRFGTQTRFGQNLSHAELGAIKLGDSVEILT